MRGPLVVGEPPAGAAGEDDVAGIGPLQQAGDVQQRRLAGAGRRDQRHHLAGHSAKSAPVQDGQLARPLDIVRARRPSAR